MVVTLLYFRYGAGAQLQGSAASNMGIWRMARILKAAKLFRVIRVLHFFSELRMMMTSLLGSLMSLVWSFVTMGTLTYLFACFFVHGAAYYMIEMGDDLDSEAE